jgi:hypothetical protein
MYHREAAKWRTSAGVRSLFLLNFDVSESRQYLELVERLFVSEI